MIEDKQNQRERLQQAFADLHGGRLDSARQAFSGLCGNASASSMIWSTIPSLWARAV